MKQMMNHEKIPCRDSTLYCQSDSCVKPPKHYCNDHNQVLCDKCSVDFHGKCNCDRIPNKNDVEEGLDLIKSLFNFTQENSEHLKTSSDTKHFDGGLMMFCEMHAKISEKFNISTEDNEFYEFGPIIKEVLQCKCEEIPDPKDVRECLDVVKNLFSSVFESSDNINAGSFIKDLDNEFKMFEEKLLKIDQNLMNSIDNHRSNELRPIMLEVIQLQKGFVESNSFTEFTKFKDLNNLNFFPSRIDIFHIKELKLVAAGGSLSDKVRVSSELYFNSVKFEKFKGEVLKEIEERNKQKIEQKVKEQREKIVDECKETMIQLEAKIKEEQQLNQKLEDKNIEISKEFKEQTEELEAQKNMITSMIAQKEEEEKQKKGKKVKYEQDQRELFDKFNKIYEKNIGEKISDILDFGFSISLKDKTDRNLLKDLNNAKLRLPNLRAVQIGRVSNNDADLISFLNNCTPAQLKLLKFNYCSSSLTTKAKFYMRSLPKLVSATTEEVYLNRLEFSEEELEQIMKASCNAERLIFDSCDIHCSTALDFGSALKYKIKVLSFQCCGDSFDSNCKADWKSTPTCFDNIIEAIVNSGLRSSIQTISICNNQTLSVEKVQKTLNKKGMSQVTVDEEYLQVEDE